MRGVQRVLAPEQVGHEPRGEARQPEDGREESKAPAVEARGVHVFGEVEAHRRAAS